MGFFNKVKQAANQAQESMVHVHGAGPIGPAAFGGPSTRSVSMDDPIWQPINGISIEDYADLAQVAQARGISNEAGMITLAQERGWKPADTKALSTAGCSAWVSRWPSASSSVEFVRGPGRVVAKPVVGRSQRGLARPVERVDEDALPEPVEVSPQVQSLQDARERVWSCAIVEERQCGNAESGVVDLHVPLAFFVVDEVPACLAAARDDGVEEDQRVHPVGNAIRDAGDHHSAVAVADEDQLIACAAVVLDGGQDVGDVGVEVDCAGQQM